MSEFPIIIPLSKPLEHGNEEITELKIAREPVWKDWFGIQIAKLSFDDLCLVSSRLTNVPVPVLRTLPMGDAMRLQEVVSAFLDSGQ